MSDIPERDWKYLRSIFDELLAELSRRINDEVRRELARDGVSENEKRLRVYKIVTSRDRIIGDCFDDWRRSTIVQRCWALQKHRLLKPEHIEKLDARTQQWIRIAAA